VRALVALGDGTVDLASLPEPVPGDSELVVRPLMSGLCGTDLELIDATIDPAYVRYPLVLGHEWVGRDDEGHLVVAEGIVPCGECQPCRRGATNLCETYDEIGFTRPGALAEAVSVPADLVHRLAEGVDPLDAVLVEPMAVVWRALRRAAPLAGSRCLVVGDGTVALLAVMLLQRFDPVFVDVLGARRAQGALALHAGARHFSNAPADERYDLVVEAAGHPDAVTTALGSVARGGTLVLLGLPPHGSTIPVAPDQLVNDDVTLIANFSYTRQAWAEVVGLLDAGHLHPSFLVTHRATLDGYATALAALRGVGADEARGKVLIEL
jgi:threonine dehydrogenase-like Zn-dependent dehydrogenase